MFASILRLTVLLAYFTSLVSATALTYKLGASEKTCFFADVAQQGAKVAFYFAVSTTDNPPFQQPYPLHTQTH